MRPYIDALLDLIYPPRCPGCRKLSEALFCAACPAGLPAIGDRLCRYCGRPALISAEDCRDCRGRLLFFDGARAVWAYEGLARGAIHAYKYANQKALAAELALYMVPLATAGAAGAPDLITWVPLTRRKTWSRGYNQAKLLAKNLARRTGLPATA